MSRSVVRGVLVALLAGALLVTCTSRNAAEPPQAARPAVTPGFDVAAVVRKVHFAFRDDGHGLAGGHTTYTSRVESGRLALRAAKAEGLGAAWTLETVRVGRTTPLSLGRPVARVAHDGAVEIDRARVVERVANRDDGVEQEWRFAQRPEGSGDLEVRVRAEGLAFQRETGTGLHFADASGSGFRYGDVAWVDADGVRTALRPRWDGENVVLALPAALVEASRYPAVLDPTISPEFGIDAPVLSGAANQQYSPDVACDGSAYLVVWQDNRAPGNTMIMGARVALDGTVVDTYGLSIGAGAYPRVAYGASSYLVVWYDWLSQKVIGTRVSPATGQVLDAPAVAISPASGGTWLHAKLAWDGAHYLVVWEDKRTNANGEIHGALVDGAAAVTVPDIAIATNSAGAVEPAVASNGTHYLVVWRDARDGPTDVANIYGARVNPDGTVADSAGFAVSTYTAEQATPAVTAHAGQFFVVWRDLRAGYRLIYGARVTDNKQVLDASGVRIYTGSS